MKIISKTHDYYDSARCFTYCSDSEAVFVRKEEEIPFPKNKYLSLASPYPSSWFEVIGFCGKIYPVLGFGIPGKAHYFYNVEDFYEFLKKHTPNQLEKMTDRTPKKVWKQFVEDFQKPESVRLPSYHSSGYEWNQKTHKMSREERGRFAFEELKKIPWMEKLFLEFGVPYFSVVGDIENTVEYYWRNPKKIVKNPVLADKEFYKAFVPTQAYQEIEMFFNSVLVGEKNPPQIVDDVILAEAKGFDRKTSFRHRAPKKKRKNRS